MKNRTIALVVTPITLILLLAGGVLLAFRPDLVADRDTLINMLGVLAILSAAGALVIFCDAP